MMKFCSLSSLPGPPLTDDCGGGCGGARHDRDGLTAGGRPQEVVQAGTGAGEGGEGRGGGRQTANERSLH